LRKNRLLKLVRSETVAVSPNPVKSRVPVYCGFERNKMVGKVRLALTTYAGYLIYSQTIRRFYLLAQKLVAEAGVSPAVEGVAFCPPHSGGDFR
jgi:hypothetical protein